MRFKWIGGQPFPRRNLLGECSASAGTERRGQCSLPSINFHWHQSAIKADIPEHANFYAPVFVRCHNGVLMSLNLAAICAAHERIRPHIHRTAVLTSSRLDSVSGASLFFKCENFQKI